MPPSYPHSDSRIAINEKMRLASGPAGTEKVGFRKKHIIKNKKLIKKNGQESCF
jgi:hypothetical protein